MDRIFFYDFYKIERDNKRWGILISAILHALLLLLILMKIFPMETDIPIVESKELVVELLMPVKEIPKPPEDFIQGGGSSAGPESEEPQEGGSSKGSEAAPALDELEKQPTQTTKIEVVKPTPIPEKVNPKPILTAPEPQVVKVNPPKVDPIPTPSKPSPPVVSNPGPVVVENKPSKPVIEDKPKPSNTGGNGSSGKATTGDDDNPGGTGGSGKTGSGSGSGQGGADSGSGTGGGGNAGNGTGGGSGDGVGVNFDETGPLKRKVSKRPNITDLARTYVQSAVFNMCINQQGAVTYIRYNPKLSKTKDKGFITEATKKLQQYIFERDLTAPKKECGLFTFNILGEVYKLTK